MTNKFPSISDSVTVLSGVGPQQAKKLSHLWIVALQDLLYHFPFRYEDLRAIKPVSQLLPGEVSTIQAELTSLKTRPTYSRQMSIVEAVAHDASGSVNIIWFNQPYLTDALRLNRTYFFSGKIAQKNGLQMQSPQWELTKKEPIHTARLVPVYPLTRGIYPKWLRTQIKSLLSSPLSIPDFLPSEMIKRQNLLPLKQALYKIHFPSSPEDIKVARKRLSFDEIFFHQLKVIQHKHSLGLLPAQHIPFDKPATLEFIRQLPFTLTASQKKATWRIIQSLDTSHPTSRLLSGDVGSGKTVVAALAALQAVQSNLKTAIMVPTEILASQHYESFKNFPFPPETVIGLLTSSAAKLSDNTLKKLSKKELLEKFNHGQIDLIIGTHSLIQKNIVPEKLGLVIVDEQHRFGVQQRAMLLRNANNSELRNPNDTKTLESSELINEKIIEKELSYQLNGIFWKIQKELGRFARERQYADALESELKPTGLVFEREKAIFAGGRKSNFADFIINQRILIETKAKPFIQKEDYYQVMRYLKAANLELGLIVNFRQEYLKPKRVLNPDFNSGHSGKFVDSDRKTNLHRLTPHFLSLTATPIPRTLALTLYGDLAISSIDELPPGRKPIITEVIPQDSQTQLFGKIKKLITEGQQVFAVCPLIDPSDKLGVKSTAEVFEHFSKEIFPKVNIGVLHGRLKTVEKEGILQNFADNKIQILISTTVIEVGIDFPNAAVMLILGAERFGLAQLHQLRGRVGRGQIQSFCYLLPENLTSKAKQRLSAMTKTNNGLKLAEFDLKLRGPGDIYGSLQSGFPEFKIADLFDIPTLQAAKEEAELAIKSENFLHKLRTNPLSSKVLKDRVHME